jgi:hypothetical protein
MGEYLLPSYFPRDFHSVAATLCLLPISLLSDRDHSVAAATCFASCAISVARFIRLFSTTNIISSVAGSHPARL